MTKAHSDGLHLFLLGCAAFLLFGVALAVALPGTLGDFRIQYFPARCLVERGDPYNAADVLGTIRRAERNWSAGSAGTPLLETEYIYPPTAFSFTALIATVPYEQARWLWLALSLALLVLAGFLTWRTSRISPTISGGLVGFALANCELIATNGNVAGVSIALCVIAACTLVDGEFLNIGALCLALALALKPHDAWLVWLYFLLVGSRHRAFKIVAATTAVSLPAILWVSVVAPRWLSELKANLHLVSMQGGTEPGVGLAMINKPSMIIDLQAAVSFFRDDPRIYNPVTYLICGLLLIAWSIITLRSQPCRKTTWLALASAATLSILPVYHRECDGKLLLLTVPACAILWSEGKLVGKVAIWITAAGLLVTADIPWVIGIALLNHLQKPNHGFSGQFLVAAQILPAPLTLLTETVFFLWVYARYSRVDMSEITSRAVGP